jgi:hypothetical protein
MWIGFEEVLAGVVNQDLRTVGHMKCYRVKSLPSNPYPGVIELSS